MLRDLDLLGAAARFNRAGGRFPLRAWGVDVDKATALVLDRVQGYEAAVTAVHLLEVIRG